MSTAKPGLFKRLKLLAIGVASIILIVGLTHTIWLQWFGDFLVSDTPTPPPADAIVVLMGDSRGERGKKTLDLYTQGKAPLIIVPDDKPVFFDHLNITRSDSDLYRTYFQGSSLPPNAVIYLQGCNNTSTVEEAICINNYLKAEKPSVKSILLVTSWYHSKRAHWVFEKFLDPNIIVHSVDAPLNGGYSQKWWANESSFIAVFEEYLKFTYWHFKFVFGVMDKDA
jgi:uncharacterized SAM-binding protein YcdF (DUF218 family)